MGSPFLAERKKLGKVEKLITSIEDKEKYVKHKCSETSTKSWIKTKKSTQSN